MASILSEPAGNYTVGKLALMVIIITIVIQMVVAVGLAFVAFIFTGGGGSVHHQPSYYPATW